MNNDYRKFLRTICRIFAVGIFSTSVNAAEGRWTEGFGQGNLEYFIDQQGLRLYIACPTQNGSQDLSSYVSLIRIDDDSEVPSFTLFINGITYEGPFSADSRVGANTFLSLLDDLRSGDAVLKLYGQSMTIKKSNAAEVLPLYDESFTCNLM